MSVCLATRCTHIGTVQLGTTWNMSATYSEHAALGSPSFGWRPMMRTTVTSALKLEALKLSDAIAKTPEPGVAGTPGRAALGGLSKSARMVRVSPVAATPPSNCWQNKHPRTAPQNDILNPRLLDDDATHE